MRRPGVPLLGFQLLVRRWLGAPMLSSADAAICSACGLQGDVNHLLCCAVMGRYARHNALDVVTRIAEPGSCGQLQLQPRLRYRCGRLRGALPSALHRLRPVSQLAPTRFA